VKKEREEKRRGMRNKNHGTEKTRLALMREVVVCLINQFAGRLVTRESEAVKRMCIDEPSTDSRESDE
jgi:hypothetical protein